MHDEDISDVATAIIAAGSPEQLMHAGATLQAMSKLAKEGKRAEQHLYRARRTIPKRPENLAQIFAAQD